MLGEELIRGEKSGRKGFTDGAHGEVHDTRNGSRLRGNRSHVSVRKLRIIGTSSRPREPAKREKAVIMNASEMESSAWELSPGR